MIHSVESVLIDSSAFVGLYYHGDAHHERAKTFFARLAAEVATTIVTTNLVVMETITILSHRDGQSLANHFLDKSRMLETVFIDESLFDDSLELFQAQKERGTSLVDCSNVVLMEQRGIQKILSFDEAYAKQYGLQFFE